MKRQGLQLEDWHFVKRWIASIMGPQGKLKRNQSGVGMAEL